MWEWLNFLFVCVEVLRPSQPNGVMSSTVSLPNPLLLGRFSPLSGQPVLCTFFCQKLTTVLLESAEGKEWPKKMFHDQSPLKNVADPAGVKPPTSWSPVELNCYPKPHPWASHWGIMLQNRRLCYYMTIFQTWKNPVGQLLRHEWSKNFVVKTLKWVWPNFRLTYSVSLPNHTFTGQALFVCVEVLRPSQPNGVMSSMVSLPNHMFTGQA